VIFTANKNLSAGAWFQWAANVILRRGRERFKRFDTFERFVFLIPDTYQTSQTSRTF